MAAQLEIEQIIIIGTISLISFASIVIYLTMRNNKRFLVQQHALEKIEQEKKHDLLRAIIRAQEEERNRIASNLHDSVGAELSMLKLNLSKYVYLSKDQKFDVSMLNSDIYNLDNTIETVRGICRDLYPITLKEYGFIRTFESLISKLNNSGAIICKYRIGLSEADIYSSLDFKLNLLRIFQEVINNIIKYAQCSYLDIGFIKDDGLIKILLKHNGIQFDDHDVAAKISAGNSMGLLSIANRINLMNGKILYLNVPGGAEIILELPLKNVGQN